MAARAEGGLPVCLIIPPSAFLLDERVFMNLGILKVAAVLEQAGYGVELLDLSGIENYTDAVADHALDSPAEIFGLTATTPQLPAARQIVQTLRSVRPGARVILGGPHVTLVNAAARRERRLERAGRATKAFAQLTELCDVLVVGDGEKAIFPAIAADVLPLLDADDRDSPLFLTHEDLTRLPFPARHLVDVASYRYTIEGVPALSVIAQLGCPFGCGFCGGRESPFLRHVRTRTVESVIEELGHLHAAYGVRGFMFYDDELNVSPAMLELMHALAVLQEGLGATFKLRGFVKAELLSDAQAAAMYEAGFRWILTGFESGSPRILDNINKRATRDDNTRCVEIARRHGLKVKALMSIGHPGESDETIRETYEWLLAVAPDDFDVSIITTYPGTPYYDHARPHPTARRVWAYEAPRTRDRLYSYEVDWTVVADYYKGRPDGGYQSFVFTDHLAPEELVRHRDWIEREARARLGIPFNPSAPAVRYEHSMGQVGRLPPYVLRTSGGAGVESRARRRSAPAQASRATGSA